MMKKEDVSLAVGQLNELDQTERTGGRTMKDGGSAFPYSVEDEGKIQAGSYGMSLRDYFAGQALVGIITKSILHARSSEEEIDRHVKIIWQYADAMIAAKEKTE